jgi:hypothetical protein
MPQVSPFQFGRVANSQNFINRTFEISKLSANFEQGINTILISPRRWGKTSLVFEAARRVQEERDDIIFCFIDLMTVRSEEDFLQKLVKEVVKSSSSYVEDWLKAGKDFFKNLMPVFSIGLDPGNDFSVSLNWAEIEKHRDEIINLPQTIALKKGKKVVICIDEFQRIRDYKNGPELESELRSYWQHHQEVSYCLYGSQRQLMRQIFLTQKRPFYRFGDIMFLNKIDISHWTVFIQDSFQNHNISISDELAASIAELMQCHPYYVQQLAHTVWNKAESVVTLQTIEMAIQELIQYNELAYSTWLNALSPTQVNLLKAISDGEKQLTSTRVMNAYRLGTPNNVRKNKQVLEDKDMINFVHDGIELLDPGFALWFRRLS